MCLSWLFFCTHNQRSHGFRFKNKLFSLDASLIDVSMKVFPWANFNRKNSAFKLHLLERGATVDAKDKNGRTALLYASSGSSAKTVGLLLRNGSDVNVQATAEGFTALMMAASEGQLEVARVLLLNGASVDTMDKDGDTAKTFARGKGHAAMIELLESQPVKGSPH